MSPSQFPFSDVPSRLFFIFLVGALLCGSQFAWAQEYGALPDSIPDRYAASDLERLRYEGFPSAVIRLEAKRLVVEDPGTATLFVRRVVTVFDDEGRSFGRQILPYGSFVEIDDLQGRILNEEGEVVTELDDEFIVDRSRTGGSLYTDARAKVAALYEDQYPYTVEYRYEKEITGPMWWPVWHPEPRDAPLEFGQFVVQHPRDHNVRQFVRADSLHKTVRRVADDRVTRWRATNRPAYEREPYGPTWAEQAPSVRVRPTVFEMAGVEGNMSTWAGLGAWYHRLKEDRDELSSEAAREMRQIVTGAPTTRDSVRRLYRHLQRETRYVSVQLGIGGWQPFPASYVRERGYGDCKALTNYLEASLAAVGVEAHPVLIDLGGDEPSILTDFPSNQFNHMVLAVPLARDTLWLENTDTTAPFDHVHAQIEDRHGLMVTPDGGRLVRTPASRATDNRRVRTATVELASDGSGSASVRTTYTGNRQDRVRLRLVDKTPREREQWLRDRIDAPSLDLNGADFSAVEADQDTVRLPFRLGLPHHAAQTGPRLFLPLNLMSRRSDVPPAMDRPRTQPVHAQEYPFVSVDSIRYELPSGYDVEALSASDTIRTTFATYETAVERTEDTLLYYRRLEWRDKTLPPTQYEAFRSFLRRVVRADDAQVVLIEQES